MGLRTRGWLVSVSKLRPQRAQTRRASTFPNHTSLLLSCPPSTVDYCNLYPSPSLITPTFPLPLPFAPLSQQLLTTAPDHTSTPQDIARRSPLHHDFVVAATHKSLRSAMASPPRALRPDHSSSSGAANRSSATYYTNEEIEILFHVVQKGESLLSELPEQDQLPTNALFLAAETVFPRHHIDPDDVPAHLSRLMFKIGGDREGTSLMDKFRSVLGGMGIELDFGGSSTSDYSPAQPSRLSSSVADNDDCRESPRVSHGQGPTRRHSSSSLSPPRAALPDRSRGRGCNGVPHHPVSLGDLQPGIQFAYGGEYISEEAE